MKQSLIPGRIGRGLEMLLHFKSPFLVLCLRMGIIALDFCSFRIQKSGKNYTMVARPRASRGGDVWVLREVLIQESYSCLLPFLPSSPIRFLDVGANIGAFTVWLHQQRKIREGFSFEPDPDSYNLCRLNSALNDCGHTTSLPLALGGKSRQAEIWSDPCRPVNSSLHQRDSTGNSVSHRISVISLQEWLDTVSGDFDLLKMDCEGSEWEILDENPGCFRRFSLIVAEVHSDPLGKRSFTDFSKALESLGFEMVRPDASGNGLYIGKRRTG